MQTSTVIGRSSGAIRRIQVVIVEASTSPSCRRMTAFAALTAAPTRVFLKLMTEARARYWARLSGTLPSSQSQAHEAEPSFFSPLRCLMFQCGGKCWTLFLPPWGTLSLLLKWKELGVGKGCLVTLRSGGGRFNKKKKRK